MALFRLPGLPVLRCLLAVALMAAGAALAGPQTSPKPAAEPMPAAVLETLKATGLPTRSFGVYARPIDGGAPLAALNAEQPYVLASTTKVITAAAALDLLGPHYRWRTYAFLTGPLVEGRLLGDLVIVGGGNARLSTADLRQWFARMREQGLREVWGDIVLDRFVFHLQESDHAHTPPPAPDRPHHARPDALTLDEGVLRVTVTPARGPRAAVEVTPPLGDVPVVNQVAMGGGCSASAALREQSGLRRLVVTGSWSAGCGAHTIAFVPLSHGELTAQAVAALWRESGGKLRGRVADRTRPATEGLLLRRPDGQPLLPWSAQVSEPLPAVIREINKTSNNIGARSLMLAMAPGFPLRAATLQGAQDRVHEWLRRQGFAPDDIHVENGSGLSREERAKPRALAELLARAWRGRSAQALVDSLPIAGVDGTLAHRMQHGMAAGQAYLKTGTLLDTRALAGYVRSRSGRVYAVAAMVNHPDAARATPALDAFIEWVVRHG